MRRVWNSRDLHVPDLDGHGPAGDEQRELCECRCCVLGLGRATTRCGTCSGSPAGPRGLVGPRR
jgi:hypothetical protein